VSEGLPANVSREREWTEHGEGPFGGRYTHFDVLKPKILGANIEQTPPGKRTCPVHAHTFEEEVFLILEGTMTVRELVPGAADYREFELHAGELVVYPPGTGLAHGFWNRSDGDVRYLGLSDDHLGEVCTYPESGKTMLRGLRAVGRFGEPGESVERDVIRLEEDERPRHVVTIDALVERALGSAFGIQASRAGGATAVMVNRDRLPPGGETAPLHWHTANEELVLVLQGAPTLRQLHGRFEKERVAVFDDATEERFVLQKGDVVHFGPERPLAHQLLNETDDDVVLLVVGNDSLEDVCVFPERGTVYVASLARAAEFTPTPYYEAD
jgi:uncharacterized cupin superfamily protein